jgi:hypothetical protein
VRAADGQAAKTTLAMTEKMIGFMILLLLGR